MSSRSRTHPRALTQGRLSRPLLCRASLAPIALARFELPARPSQTALRACGGRSGARTRATLAAWAAVWPGEASGTAGGLLPVPWSSDAIASARRLRRRDAPQPFERESDELAPLIVLEEPPVSTKPGTKLSASAGRIRRGVDFEQRRPAADRGNGAQEGEVFVEYDRRIAPRSKRKTRRLEPAGRGVAAGQSCQEFGPSSESDVSCSSPLGSPSCTGPFVRALPSTRARVRLDRARRGQHG